MGQEIKSSIAKLLNSGNLYLSPVEYIPKTKGDILIMELQKKKMCTGYYHYSDIHNNICVKYAILNNNKNNTILNVYSQYHVKHKKIENMYVVRKNEEMHIANYKSKICINIFDLPQMKLSKRHTRLYNNSFLLLKWGLRADFSRYVRNENIEASDNSNSLDPSAAGCSKFDEPEGMLPLPDTGVEAWKHIKVNGIKWKFNNSNDTNNIEQINILKVTNNIEWHGRIIDDARNQTLSEIKNQTTINAILMNQS